jgi:hypothetical protein
MKKKPDTPANSLTCNTGRYEIDKVYSLEIPCSKEVEKVIFFD